MQYLKADTAVNVKVGPFVDATDGLTPETGVTLAAADEAELLKHGSTSVTDISSNSWGAITNCDGWYWLNLTTGNLDTEGPLSIVIQDDSVCLPVHVHFMVVNANVYDSLFAAATTDYLQVDTLQVEGSDATDQIRDSVVDDATRIDASSVNAIEAKVDTVDGIVDNILTDTGTTLDGKLDTIDGIVDAILVDTGTTLDGIVDAIKAKTDNLPADPADDSDIDSQLATIDTVVDAIKAKTDLLPSGVPKNTEWTCVFVMRLSSDHVTPATGKTVTVQVSKDGGAFANSTNSPAEIANGWYKIVLTSTEMNANFVAVKVTETDCDQTNIGVVTST